MRRTRIQAPVQSEKDERIARLEAEVDELRRGILDLTPEGISDLPTGYRSCMSSNEHHRWKQDVVAAVIERAVPDPAASYWQDRALCPLCRSGCTSPGDEGYTLPLGLSRHLEGFGNVRQRPITKAVFRSARDHLQRCFQDEEEAARRPDEARRSSERMYLTAPWATPRLLDEHLPRKRAPRNKHDLEAAERR